MSYDCDGFRKVGLLDLDQHVAEKSSLASRGHTKWSVDGLSLG